MMNRPIDGVVLTARLARAALGENVYRNVALRRRDGSEVKIGQVRVAQQLGQVLVPGREGRFHFQAWMGVQGLYAYAPVGRNASVAFPMHAERGFALLALLNLAMVAAWLPAESGLPLVPLTLGVLATSAWATCRACRETLTHALKYENRTAAARRSHRRAVMSA